MCLLFHKVFLVQLAHFKIINPIKWVVAVNALHEMVRTIANLSNGKNVEMGKTAVLYTKSPFTWQNVASNGIQA